MSVIAAVQGVLPPHRYTQEEITDAFVRFPGYEPHEDLLRKLHANAKVDSRHFVLPLERYSSLTTSVRRTTSSSRTRSNSDVRPCPARSTRRASSRSDVDLIVTTTVTGLAVPSLDARIAGRLGLRPDVRRVPIFGLGCVAGAAGVGRLNDYLRGAPDDVAVLVSVELCSLTYPGAEPTIATMVGSALFADGASAVVAVGERRAERIGVQGPTVVDSRSRLYPDSLTTMGWNFGASGLSLVLSPNVATTSSSGTWPTT